MRHLEAMWRFEEEIEKELSLNVTTLRSYDVQPTSANVVTLRCRDVLGTLPARIFQI